MNLKQRKILGQILILLGSILCYLWFDIKLLLVISLICLGLYIELNAIKQTSINNNKNKKKTNGKINNEHH